MRGSLTALLFLTVPAFCLALSSAETSLINKVKLEQQNQLRFLQRLTDINSGTLNIAGVRKTGSIVSEELTNLGFKTSWVEEPVSMHRAGTLIAHHEGKGKRILLIAHLDTVFSAAAPFQAYSQKKQIAKGQGVIDDKGGIAVLLYALKALHATGQLQNAAIDVVMTGDEEESGKPASISRKPLVDAARQCDIALDFEPSISLNSATIARRGISNWTITTRGTAAHSAGIFHDGVGYGAIFGLAQQLNAMRAQMQNVRNLSFNPGIVMGGSSLHYDSATASGSVDGRENVVASLAIAKGDLRYIDARQKQFATKRMQKIVSQKLPGVNSEIMFVDGIPPMALTRNNLKLLQLYSQVSVDLGHGKVTPVAASARGAADISYVAEIVPANLSGLGPVGYGAHTMAETLELPSLEIQTGRAALLISRLLKTA